MVKAPIQKPKVILKHCTLMTKAKTDPIAKANLDAFHEIVDMLLEQPDQILYVHARVKSGKLSDSSSPSSWSTPEAWPEDPQTFGSIPKYWLWQLVRNIEPKFTPDFIENLEANSGVAVAGTTFLGARASMTVEQQGGTEEAEQLLSRCRSNVRRAAVPWQPLEASRARLGSP